jgi:hypothetical protein
VPAARSCSRVEIKSQSHQKCTRPSFSSQATGRAITIGGPCREDWRQCCAVARSQRGGVDVRRRAGGGSGDLALMRYNSHPTAAGLRAEPRTNSKELFIT